MSSEEKIIIYCMKGKIRESRIFRLIPRLVRECMQNTLWTVFASQYAKNRGNTPLKYEVYSHKTPLDRKFDVPNRKLLLNKRVNLSLALEVLNGVLIFPGKKFSFWRLMKKPVREKGYIDGMTLFRGKIVAQTAGGLCQLSNMIFWMMLHSPLEVAERWRHGYDVFPDANRKIPFGCGATIAYPRIDLVLFNPTKITFQMNFRTSRKFLIGEIRSDKEIDFFYEIVEKNHAFRGEKTGRLTRSNDIYRKIYDRKTGKFLEEEFLFSNSALTMYSPLIETDRGK